MISPILLLSAASMVATVNVEDTTNRDIVAATLIAEAGGEGDKGMWAVMCVIKNRAKGSGDVSKWKTVVTKKSQFSCFDGKKPADVVAAAKNHPKWDCAVSIVERADGDFTDYTYGATHYHTLKVKPYWTSPVYGGKNKKAIVTIVIKNHVFLRNVD